MTTHMLRAADGQPVALVRPGLVDYRESFALQHRLVARRSSGTLGDMLLLLEHPAVYTLGKRTDRDNLLWTDAERRARGIDLIEVDRGGDVTYHGPGQLVGYPILQLASLRSVVDYVRTLEQVLIDTLAQLDVEASRKHGFTGVWVDDRKIAAIGVRVASGGITSHGFALNVSPRLSDFDGIVPCGIRDHGICSLESLGVSTSIDELSASLSATFSQHFNGPLVPTTLAELDDTVCGRHDGPSTDDPVPTAAEELV